MLPASEAPARFLLRLDIQASITECHRPDLRGILPIRVVPMKMPRIQGKAARSPGYVPPVMWCRWTC
jgi:hypothetical protein